MFEQLFARFSRLVRESNVFQTSLAEKLHEGANRRTIYILIGAGFAFFVVYMALIAPPRDFPVGELVTIPEGASLEEASSILEAAGTVEHAWALELLVRARGRANSVRAGDYLFSEPRTLFSVAESVTTGEFGLEPIRVHIPEGSTVRDMSKIYAHSLLRVDEEQFIALGTPYEGYLFPDTYFFLPNVREATIIRAMQQNFDTHIATIQDKLDAFERPFSDVVIMASLLEREAFNKKDRRMIAGVLWGRLDRGMLLQVDAAFLYSIGRSTFQLTLSDLREDSPYNTYVKKGLPPTPIGSPSLSAIEAAVTPIDEGYVFYLADRHGTTYYSKTYEEHLRKKSLYLGS